MGDNQVLKHIEGKKWGKLKALTFSSTTKKVESRDIDRESFRVHKLMDKKC